MPAPFTGTLIVTGDRGLCKLPAAIAMARICKSRKRKAIVWSF